MFNPNTAVQMMESVKSDMDDLGMITTTVWVSTGGEWCSFNVSCTNVRAVAALTFIGDSCKIYSKDRRWTVKYKGSLEQLSEDVITRVFKIALSKIHNVADEHCQNSRSQA